MTRPLIHKMLGQEGTAIMRALRNLDLTYLRKEPMDGADLNSFQELLDRTIRTNRGGLHEFNANANPTARALYTEIEKGPKAFKERFPWSLTIRGLPGVPSTTSARAKYLKGDPVVIRLLLPQIEFLSTGFIMEFPLHATDLPVTDPRLKLIFSYILEPKLPFSKNTEDYNPEKLQDDREGLVIYSDLNNYIRSYREILPAQLVYHSYKYYLLKQSETQFGAYLTLYQNGRGTPDTETKGVTKAGLIQCHQNPTLWLKQKNSAEVVTPQELLEIINTIPDEEPTEEELKQEMETISKLKPIPEAAKTPEELERIRLKNENDPWVKYKDAPDWACQIIEGDTTHEYPWPTELPKFLKVDPSRVPTRKELGFPHLADGNWEDGTRWGRMLRARYAAVLSLWGGAALDAMPNEVPNHEDYLLHKEAVIEYEAYKKAHPEEDL
jgi:hypothetical protein